MRILALAAVASLSVAPTLTMAQGVCPANAGLVGGACVCSDGFQLGQGGACVMPPADSVVAVDPGGTVTKGMFGNIPPAALGVGAAALLAGAAFGIANAVHDDDDTTTTTTTTN